MGERPDLRLIFSGEIPDDGPQTLAEAYAVIHELQDVAAGLERKQRGLLLEIANLRRDKEREARESGLWPIAERLFVIWQRATGRHRTKFDHKRYELIAPFLRSYAGEDLTSEDGPPRNALEECAAAIIGRAEDHFTAKRSNGSLRHFNEFERIFADRREFDESRDRRPRDWRERLAKLDPGPISTGPRSID